MVLIDAIYRNNTEAIACHSLAVLIQIEIQITFPLPIIFKHSITVVDFNKISFIKHIMMSLRRKDMVI